MTTTTTSNHINQNTPLAIFKALLLLLMLVPFAVFSADPEDEFRAHEWGTFTTLHFPNGTQQAWFQQIIAVTDGNQIVSDLPRFVHSNIYGQKQLTIATARMETPVIYFYTNKPRTVDVTVRYPSGRFTEYYPGQPEGVGPMSALQLSPYVPYTGTPDGWTSDVVSNNSNINTSALMFPQLSPPMVWKKLQLIPIKEAGELTQSIPVDQLKLNNHYYEARNVPDAALVKANSTVKNGADEVDNFLFYRGMGALETNLNVNLNSRSKLTVTNRNRQFEMEHVWVVKNVDEQISWQKLKPFKKYQNNQAVPEKIILLTDLTNDGKESVSDLEESMKQALIDSGLTNDEAAAMISTWDAQWYQEPGQRVFSIIPRKLIDQVLPLSISPQPDSIERVFVHRQEVIDPNTITKLEEAMNPTFDKQKAQEAFSEAQLGRFAPGIVQGVATRIGQRTHQEYLSAGMALLKRQKENSAKVASE